MIFKKLVGIFWSVVLQSMGDAYKPLLVFLTCQRYALQCREHTLLCKKLKTLLSLLPSLANPVQEIIEINSCDSYLPQEKIFNYC